MEHHSDQTSPEYGRRRQSWIFAQGLGHIVPRVPVEFSALEERARRVMTKRGFAYVAGGAGHEQTMFANRAAFDRWRIVPRMLRDVSRRDLSLTLFGERLLPEVVEVAGGRLPVLFDSGIRSGADMFKALALGASAICLGRPYVYGLAIAGEHGVREVIQNILGGLT